MDQGVRDATDAQLYDAIIHRMRENPELRETIGAYLNPRHPSQLYEAALEGLVLFAILYATRRAFPRLRDGVLTALFFIFYAIFRITAEQFREPDSSMIWLFTKGQFYSVFMIGIGASFLAWAFSRPNPNRAHSDCHA
jgi:phosphatidylglycerol:prolipoprotein diacylglycerol transferase